MLRPNEPFQYDCPVATRTFRSTVATAFANLAHELFDHRDDLGGSRSSQTHLDAARVPLEHGIPAQQLTAQQSQIGPDAELRRQDLDQIEQRLSDPDLTPNDLATQFSVSLRTVHKLFEALPKTAPSISPP